MKRTNRTKKRMFPGTAFLSIMVISAILMTLGMGALAAENEVTRVGYDLVGFSSSPDGSPPIYRADIVLGGDVLEDIFDGDTTRESTLYAIWTPKTYTILYNANGGTGTAAPQTGVIINDTIVLPSASFSRAGYSLLGFSTRSTANDTGYGLSSFVLNDSAILDIFAGDTTTTGTLYAIWEIIIIDIEPEVIAEAEAEPDDETPLDDETEEIDDETETDLEDDTELTDMPDMRSDVNVGGGAGSGVGNGANGGTDNNIGSDEPNSEFGDGLVPGEGLDADPDSDADTIISETTRTYSSFFGGPDDPRRTTLEMLEDEGVPLIIFGDGETPLFGFLPPQVPVFSPPGLPVWALFNLILCAIAVILVIIKIIRAIIFMVKKDKWREEEYAEIDEDDGERNRRPKHIRFTWLIVSGVIALADIILFFIVVDMTLLMVLIDIWTIVFAILLVLVIVAKSLVFSRKDKKEEPDDEKQSPDHE